MSMRVRRVLPPLTCTRATTSETFRHGQGWQGYDTKHDTRNLLDSLKSPRPELSSREGVEWRGHALILPHTIFFKVPKASTAGVKLPYPWMTRRRLLTDSHSLGYFGPHRSLDQNHGGGRSPRFACGGTRRRCYPTRGKIGRPCFEGKKEIPVKTD